MVVLTEREGKHVGTLTLRSNSTMQCLKYIMLAPENVYDTVNGTKTVLEFHELGAVTIDFKDSREIEELIAALIKFKDDVYNGIGRWK